MIREDRRTVLMGGSALLVNAAFGGALREAIADEKPFILGQHAKPSSPPSKIRWNEQIQVLSAVGQRYKAQIKQRKFSGIASEENLSPAPPFSFYTKALLGELRKKSISSFAEAHFKLEQTGYPVRRQAVSAKGRYIAVEKYYPTSTPHKLTAWETGQAKSVETPKRFALLIGDKDIENNRWSRADLDMMQALLMSNAFYNLSYLPSQPSRTAIMRIDKGTRSQTLQGIKWLGEQLESNEGSEALLFIACHGTTLEHRKELKIGRELEEGRCKWVASGSGVAEEDLENWLNKYCGQSLDRKENPSKLLIIADSCHAGALIA